MPEMMMRRLVHEERGIALVLALVTMTVLSILTGALLTEVVVNQQTTVKSSDARKAFGIAEAGLAYAEGNLYGAAAAHDSSQVHQDAQTFSLNGGNGTYWSSVAGDGHTWTMYGTGTYGGVTRQVHAQADVPSPVTVTNAGVWNYLYADSTNGSCPTTIGGSTIVSVPVLTRGNLCLQSQFSGAQLEVGGNLTVSGGKGQIGTASSKVPVLRVAGKCNTVTAGTGACDGTKSPIYATSASPSLTVSPQMPPIDLAAAYNAANPGPATGHGCQTGSGVPTPFFDNDTTLNHSLGTANLLPATAYDCVNGANEIKWTPPGTVNNNASDPTYCPTGGCLYLRGTFFFDGNLSLSGNSTVIINGQGTLYFSGSVATAGGFHLCGIAGCTTAWDPDTHGAILIAGCWNNSTGSQLVSLATTSSYCVSYGGNSVVQVGTYCPTDYFIAGTATNMGPVLSNTLTLNGNMSTLVPFNIMPPGTPLNTATEYLPASSPTYWSG